MNETEKSVLITALVCLLLTSIGSCMHVMEEGQKREEIRDSAYHDGYNKGSNEEGWRCEHRLREKCGDK